MLPSGSRWKCQIIPSIHATISPIWLFWRDPVDEHPIHLCALAVSFVLLLHFYPLFHSRPHLTQMRTTMTKLRIMCYSLQYGTPTKAFTSSHSWSPPHLLSLYFTHFSCSTQVPLVGVIQATQSELSHRRCLRDIWMDSAGVQVAGDNACQDVTRRRAFTPETILFASHYLLLVSLTLLFSFYLDA